MPRSRASSNAKPHQRAKAEKRVGRDAPPLDPWAARIRKELLDGCHPWQRDGVTDPAKLLTYLVGRGGGKTTCLKARYLIEMTGTSNGSWIYACPTLGDAIELLWDPLQETCSALGILDECTWMEAPREGGKILIINRTGSRLKLIGVDDKKQINRCRGRPFNGVGCDEVGFWGNDVIRMFVSKVVQPRIGERHGWIAMASSPGDIPSGFFWERTADGQTLHRPYAKRAEYAPDWGGWSSHAWELGDVVKLPKAAQRYPALVNLRASHLEIKKNEGYSDDNPIWRREYMGKWARDNTTTVFRFDEALNLWDPAPGTEGLLLLRASVAALKKASPKHELHFVLAADKGNPRKPKEGKAEQRTGDPYAINVFAFAPADPKREIHHVYHLERTGLYARPLAQILLGPDEKSPTGCKPHHKPEGILGVIGWPDGMVFDADTGTIEELANVYGLRFEKPDKRPDYKFGLFELTNSELVEARIKALKGSPLHLQLAALQWAEQDSGALKEDPSQPNHSTDTLIYARKLIAKLYEHGIVSDERTSDVRAPDSSYEDPMGLDQGSPFDLLDPGDFTENDWRY